MLLLDLLVNQNKITELDAHALEAEITDHPETIIDEKLVDLKVPDDQLLEIRSTLYGIPVYKGEIPHDPVLSKIITNNQAKRLLALPLELKDEVLLVGIVDPEHGNALDALQFMFGPMHRAYKVYLISYSQFTDHFSSKKGGGDTGEKKGKVVKSADGKEEIIQVGSEDKEDELGEGDQMVDLTEIDSSLGESLLEQKVPKIFNTLLRYAIDNTASDLHIEHMGDKVRARFRLDGSLETMLVMPPEMHQTLIARIKILCQMKLDEKRKPQDGRFSTKLEDHKIDYRVSTFPGYYGEKVVIRILDSYRGVRSLDTIGLTPTNLAKIREALARPYGIILISGPTGSGKTTTLYAMLAEVDKEHKNVVSLEDPIEYNIGSINQSQVFPEIGYTFASGLRSILRQDPDIIMVGEIRDAETAALAIQAALTGHLVFSTIHTNTSVGVITRLIDMGIEPYLIAPSLNLTIGQRLVRSIAPGCEKEMTMDVGMKAMIEAQFKDLADEVKKDLPLDKPLHEATPSKDFPSGLKGRMPVFEVLTVDEDIQDGIIKKKSEDDLWAIARKKGMLTMKEDAIFKSIEGKVPFIEVNEL